MNGIWKILMIRLSQNVEHDEGEKIYICRCLVFAICSFIELFGQTKFGRCMVSLRRNQEGSSLETDQKKLIILHNMEKNDINII